MEEPGVVERIILKWFFKECDEDMDWVELAQNRERSHVIVNTVMNLLVP